MNLLMLLPNDVCRWEILYFCMPINCVVEISRVCIIILCNFFIYVPAFIIQFQVWFFSLYNAIFFRMNWCRWAIVSFVLHDASIHFGLCYCFVNLIFVVIINVLMSCIIIFSLNLTDRWLYFSLLSRF